MAARTRSGRGKRQKRKQSKTPQNPARRPLTFRQERLVAALPTAPSIAAAGRAAGYAEATVRDRSWYRMVYEKLRPLALSNLARVGLTPSVAAKKHFDLLNAKKPMMFEGEVVGSFEDNPTQMQALETYYRILGVVGRVAGDAPEELETGSVPEIHFHFSGPVKPKADGQADGRFRVMLEK